MTSRKSFEPAVMPVTATSAPGSLPTVAGTTSSRRTSSECFDAASVPLPFTASDKVATVLSGLMSRPDGSESCPVAMRLVVQLAASRPGPAGVVTSLALIDD